MTTEPMTYKGYYGSAEVSVEDDVLHGRLLFIKDVVTYEAETPGALMTAFQEAVDDYLATCQEMGETPDVPFKGTFNVRVGPSRHREAALAARRKGQSLNDYVVKAIDNALGAPNHVGGPVTVTLTISDNSPAGLMPMQMTQQLQWGQYVSTATDHARH